MALTLANDNISVKQLLVSQMLNKSSNCAMDMNAVRRHNLRALIAREFGDEKGAVTAYGSKYEIPESRLSQVLSETYRGGKNFGEKAARTIEKMIGVPAMSLDALDGQHAEPDKESAPLTFNVLTGPEAQLVMIYRGLSGRNKNRLIFIANELFNEQNSQSRPIAKRAPQRIQVKPSYTVQKGKYPAIERSEGVEVDQQPVRRKASK